LVLVDQSACFTPDEPKGDCWEQAADVVNVSTPMPRQFRELLVAANKESVPLLLTGVPKTKVVRFEDVEKIFTHGSPNGWDPERWDEFYEAHPEAWGFAQISQPVVTKDGRQALIYYRYSCGGLCGYANLYYLVRSISGWEVVEKTRLWVS